MISDLDRRPLTGRMAYRASSVSRRAWAAPEAASRGTQVQGGAGPGAAVRRPVPRNGRGRAHHEGRGDARGGGAETVSRVVNDEPGVTPETAARVRNAINELGFRRNDSARLLRKGQTASIGLIMEDIDGNRSTRRCRGRWRSGALEWLAAVHRLSDEDPQREQELVLASCARRVDGLIVIPASGDHRYLLPEIAAGVASVFVDRPAGMIDADAVLADNVGGARAGVAHLFGHGHRGSGSSGTTRSIYTAATARGVTGKRWPRPGCPVDPAGSHGQAAAASVQDALTQSGRTGSGDRGVLWEQPDHGAGAAGPPR